MNDPLLAARVVTDELASQREKRLLRLLDQPIVDDPSMTLRDVVTSVARAVDSLGPSLDVATFLEHEGYGGRTITSVLAYLDAEGGRP